MKKVHDITDAPKKRSLKSKILKTAVVGTVAAAAVIAVNGKRKNSSGPVAETV